MGAALSPEMVRNAPVTLAAENVFGQAGLALLQNFADADDGNQAGVERGQQLAIDRVVGLAEVLAALGVADDDVRAAGGRAASGRRFRR